MDDFVFKECDKPKNNAENDQAVVLNASRQPPTLPPTTQRWLNTMKFFMTAYRWFWITIDRGRWDLVTFSKWLRRPHFVRLCPGFPNQKTGCGMQKTQYYRLYWRSPCTWSNRSLSRWFGCRLLCRKLSQMGVCNSRMCFAVDKPKIS